MSSNNNLKLNKQNRNLNKFLSQFNYSIYTFFIIIFCKKFSFFKFFNFYICYLLKNIIIK